MRGWLAQNRWGAYGLALVASALAASLSVALAALLEPTPAVLYLVAVIAAAWFGGFGPALLASLVCTLALYWFNLALPHQFQPAAFHSLMPFLVFVLTAATVGVLAASRRRADHAQVEAASAKQASLVAAEAARRRANFLAEVGTLLASSLDFTLAIENLARMAVAHDLADWCLVDVFEPDSSLQRVAAIHRDADKQVLVSELQQRYRRLAPRAPHTLWKVLVPEQAWLDPVVDERRLEAEARDPEHFRLLRDIGFKSEMVVPLTARGRTLGAITLVRGEPGRPYSQDDLSLAQELARRAGLAADNARLYAEAQRLNTELELRVRERTAQLERRVTEHEQTLATLQEKEHRLAEAQQIAHLGSWHHDLISDAFSATDELYRIYGLDPAAARITAAGYRAYVHPEDRARVVALLEAARQTCQPFDFEHRITRPDGQVRTLQARGTLALDDAGRAVAMDGTAQDITERLRLAAELIRSHEELSTLSAHLHTAREEERARIAREIHDELGGSLTGVKMDVARLRRVGQPGSPEWLKQVETVSAALDGTVQTVRRIATELRPAILDDFGLVAAVEWQLNEFQARSGIACELQAGLEQVDLDHASATALFRVFQETLTNVARHAQATQVRVRLYQEPGGLVLQVSDNGRGMDPAGQALGKTFGLMGMRERVRMLSGQLDIRSSLAQGTTVLVQVPLPQANGRATDLSLPLAPAVLPARRDGAAPGAS